MQHQGKSQNVADSCGFLGSYAHVENIMLYRWKFSNTRSYSDCVEITELQPADSSYASSAIPYYGPRPHPGPFLFGLRLLAWATVSRRSLPQISQSELSEFSR